MSGDQGKPNPLSCFSLTYTSDIRLDWETYVPEDKADKLVELRVFYGPPFPLKDQAGNEIVCPEKPKNSSLLGLLSPSSVSEVSHATAPLVSKGSGVDKLATKGH